MRRIILIFSLLLTLGSAVDLSAKDLSKFLIRGYIYDKEYTPLDSVEVSLSKDGDTSPLKYKLLSGNAEKNIVIGSQLRLMVESGLGDYTLLLEKEGYEPLVKKIKIASMSEEVKYIGALTLEKERHRELKEVTVTATRLKMVMKGDTIEYDAGAFQLNEGSMLDALVRQLPGATIDSDGVITVNGRKVNELLINGKDFFKGDPKVALQNLPAYTVKNVQVYDKSDEDANITGSNAKLDTREDDQNLVMDVNLKKEFNTGWMANAEAGIGTSDRYRGRAFGLGYTDKFRLGAFVNANNVGDTDKASAAGEWGDGWTEDGQLNIKMGGLDYNYDNSKRIRASGNLTLSHEDVHSDKIVSTTEFYPTGDLYRRAVNIRKEKKNHLMSSHDFRYKGDNVNVWVSPTIDWLVRDRGYNDRSATFATNPEETYKGEAIDQLFSNNFGGSYSKSLLTALHSLRAQHDTWFHFIMNGSVTIRPKNWRGYLTLYAHGESYDSPMKDRTLYKQTIGPLGDQNAVPQISDRYEPSSTKRRNMSTNLSYNYSKHFMNDEVSNELNLRAAAGYYFHNNHNDIDYYLADTVKSMDRLPGLYTPEDARRDLENTRYSTPTDHNMSLSMNAFYTRQPLAPGDSTLNPTWMANIGLTGTHSEKKLHFVKPEIMDEIVRRNTNYLSPNVQFTFSSANKKRYLSATLSGYYSVSTPDLYYLLNNVDNSDPFNITLGNPDGLKNATNYRVTAIFRRFGRSVRRPSFYWDAHFYVNQNTVAMSRAYDPATGITVSKPENVNGNWHIDSYLLYTIQLGPRQQVELNGVVYGEYHNIVNYASVMAAPLRNTVYNELIWCRLRATYKFKQGSTVGVMVNPGWNGVRSPLEGFNNLNQRTCNLGLTGNFLLPYNIEANTSLTASLRGGYADQAMNETEWLWNATVSKSIMNGNMAFKLTAYDILNSVRNVSSTVTTIGRVETWKSTLPRYVMVSMSYRFAMKPKDKR
ncbi:MAG: outer membrane beta-barrel family protein [Paramuribaculum sp.]|nr:outer membrane beta-barrel family protein [Paramuribaculum sp.]MDE6304692.1 outer membrane beta-barrel family protein [Paramuribaculum sp.]